MFYRIFFVLLLCHVANAQIAQNCLKESYDDILHIDDLTITFRDSTTLQWKDNSQKIYEEKLNNPFMSYSFDTKYPTQMSQKPELDSSRIRDIKFFKKIYGTSKQSVENNLEKIKWIDESYVLFNTKNNASEALKRVIHNLKTLKEENKKYLTNIGGTYKWRNIADSNNLSPHSFGIAIDINVKYSRYWLWDIQTNNNKKIEQIPAQIVEIFENEGFIWGGKWWHYDTMHFEYRPEILCFSRHDDR
ncbi:MULTISPECIES: M15 family metallopeptidase [Helicobacter]|uniref:M15 family metallopeptidase n=1 Tax=Helicobacter ibis TaxID=2962633 RepID=A0ABT4VE22_9HELI|nr:MULTISPECIES: M15 family metallopeptidase [Helicobacter]MDA3966460.1 M15 family metallopeptidase [Helicobacter sp. WB40]MDA3968925.1 M15 family metallopeptidase [Helicobacter ibis]